MKIRRSISVINHRIPSYLAAACLYLTVATAWGAGLEGYQVQGNLILPWVPEAGNWFSAVANGSPTSSLPTTAIVGPGIEFAYQPSTPGVTFRFSVSADISDSQIRINENYVDSNPASGGLVEISSFTLTLSSLNWAGAPGISGPTVILQDPDITLLGFDAHSVQFNIDSVTLYTSGPYSYSRTTVIQLTAAPEPSAAALFLCGAAVAALWKKNPRAWVRNK